MLKSGSADEPLKLTRQAERTARTDAEAACAEAESAQGKTRSEVAEAREAEAAAEAEAERVRGMLLEADGRVADAESQVNLARRRERELCKLLGLPADKSSGNAGADEEADAEKKSEERDSLISSAATRLVSNLRRRYFHGDNHAPPSAPRALAGLSGAALDAAIEDYASRRASAGQPLKPGELMPSDSRQAARVAAASAAASKTTASSSQHALTLEVLQLEGCVLATLSKGGIGTRGTGSSKTPVKKAANSGGAGGTSPTTVLQSAATSSPESDNSTGSTPPSGGRPKHGEAARREAAVKPSAAFRAPYTSRRGRSLSPAGARHPDGRRGERATRKVLEFTLEERAKLRSRLAATEKQLNEERRKATSAAPSRKAKRMGAAAPAALTRVASTRARGARAVDRYAAWATADRYGVVEEDSRSVVSGKTDHIAASEAPADGAARRRAALGVADEDRAIALLKAAAEVRSVRSAATAPPAQNARLARGSRHRSAASGMEYRPSEPAKSPYGPGAAYRPGSAYERTGRSAQRSTSSTRRPAWES